ncbi:MAG: hypothetical protein ACP5OA_05635 [Candidatus Woesearchaeota archaeon]
MDLKKYLLTAGLAMTIGVNVGLSQTNKIKIVEGAGTVYNVSQRQAEKEIAKLSLTDSIEDSWIYHKDILIDDGMFESGGTVAVNIPWIAKTETGDTIKVNINSGDTIMLYHNHTQHAPPGKYDIVTHSIIIDIIPAGAYALSKVGDYGKMWEYSLEDSLMRELHGKTYNERYNILETKINKAYNKKCEYFSSGPYPCPYQPVSTRKGYKEYRKIMDKVGVKTRYYRPK